jgi:hypothetical protein
MSGAKSCSKRAKKSVAPFLFAINGRRPGTISRITLFIVCLITVLRPAQEFFTLYGDVTIAGEGLQNIGLCSALRAFEHGEIFIVSHLL